MIDPRFVDASSGNYHLAGNSPLLHQVECVYAWESDVYGHTTRTGGRCDLGAIIETIYYDNFEGPDAN